MTRPSQLHVDQLTQWLTPERLSRINHLRERANEDVVTATQMVAYLARLNGKELKLIKDRIG